MTPSYEGLKTLISCVGSEQTVFGTMFRASLSDAKAYCYLLFPDVMKTVRHHLIAQLRRGLQGHFGRVWEGFERLLIRNKDLLFPDVRNRPSDSGAFENALWSPFVRDNYKKDI